MMKMITREPRATSITLLTAFVGYGFYLAARTFLPVPDLIYKNIYLAAALLLVECFILLKLFTLKPLGTTNIGKRSIYLVAVFSGLNGVFAAITYWRLSADEWLANIRLNAIMLPLLPYLAVIAVLVWLVIMLLNADLQRQVLPNHDVERVYSYFRDPKNDKVILFAFFGIGLCLRLINISGYPPANDEHYQLRSAFEILNGVPVNYLRGFYTVSLPIAVSFKLFGVGLLSARLPMVLFNMAAIFPLYALTRKLDRWIGYASVMLFIVNPNIVALAQLSRDYAVTPLFLFMTMLLVGELVRSPNVIDINKWVAENKTRLVLLLLILGFVFYGGRQSIIQADLLVYAVFIGEMILVALFDATSPRVKWSLFVGSGLAIAALLIFPSRSPIEFAADGSLLVSASLTPLRVLGWHPYPNWSFLLPQISWIMMIFGLVLLSKSGFSLREPEQRYRFALFAPFYFGLLYMSLFLYNDELGKGYRYAVILQELLIPIAAIFWVGIARWVKDHYTQPVGSLSVLIAIFFVFIFNLPAFNTLAKFSGGSRSAITDINHRHTDDVVEAITEVGPEPTFLLSDNFISALQLAGSEIPLQNMIRFSDVRKRGKTLKVDRFGRSEGWMVLDEDDASEMGWDEEDLNINGVEFTFMRKVPNGMLWRWRPSQP